MLPELVLLMAIVVGVSFVGLTRKRDPGQRGYLMVVGGVLLLCLGAVLGGDRFVSVVAVSLGLLVVVMPWALDLMVRAAFARERLALAVRLASWRAMLMPGAGLARQQAILQGLAVLERRGVDEAVSYFRARVHETEDESELRLLHEQIVSMLLYGQRWNEGIAHYEARFPLGYAAQRPPLALGLLRAYGEAGRLDSAASLLRAVEELLGSNPRATGVVSQARLTFLAYVGATEPVDAALTKDRRRRLGLSPASGALFRGIALWRAGRVDDAQAELSRVEGLAGSRDERVLIASRRAIEGLPPDAEAVPLAPELRRYVERVATRLETVLAAAPVVRRTGPLRVTPLLLLLLVSGYLVGLVLGGGGPGLLRLGAATPELVRAGSWGRLVTGLWVQSDPIGLLLSVYGVWLAGPLVERLYGRGRMLLVSVGAGAIGVAGAVMLAPAPAMVLGGASLMATGTVMAALWVLLLPRTELPGRTRRILALPLVLLLFAIAISIPRGQGPVLAPVGLVLAAGASILLIGLVPPRGVAATIARGLAGVLALAVPAAAIQVALEDPRSFLLEHRAEVSVGDVVLLVPSSFEPVLEVQDDGGPWPRLVGLDDTLARRGGHRVQLVVTTVAASSDEPCAVLRMHPELLHELDEAAAEPPAAWLDAYRRTGEAGELRTTILRRNGYDVGMVIERVIGSGSGARSVALVAAPPRALEDAPRLYSAVLADARLAGP
ncbi:MAG: rhomboid family intramembrane serine protease [Myxococcales bacterium]|nr:rhomboid family intramembrane serine protease [Myxococcales bacterium]MCB9713948.1 rhomboid family intramembrane serine protease [Myxococcales bacterium]